MTDQSVHYECDLFEWAEKQIDLEDVYPEFFVSEGKRLDAIPDWLEALASPQPSPAPQPYVYVYEPDPAFLEAIDEALKNGPDPLEGLFEMADLMYETWEPVQREAAEMDAMNNRIGQSRRRAAKRKSENPYTRKDIADLLELQDGRCCYCGMPFDGNDYQIDHMLPIVQGGTNDVENIALACKPCNLTKNADTVEQWQARRHW